MATRNYPGAMNPSRPLPRKKPLTTSGIAAKKLAAKKQKLRSAEGAQANAFRETLQGMGPINAHPRPLGMGAHMGGAGKASMLAKKTKMQGR